MNLKGRGGCKFVVYADDILILCQNQKDSTALYFELLNHLHEIKLDVNKAKVQQNRFTSGILNFVGFKFAGGSVGISEAKIGAFKEDLATLSKSLPKPFNERAYIKKINQKLSGFGHFYKTANVVNTFEKLDSYIRGLLRQE